MSNFIRTNEQFGSGFEVNEYQGRYSLISAREYQGKIFQKWGELEIGKDKTKRLPVAIELGMSREEAIENLKMAIAKLQGQATEQGENPPPYGASGGDDVPF